MEYPAELRYSAEHEWARRDGDDVIVGITDFAQDALGDIVYVQLPDEGLEVIAGAAIGEVESTKSVSEIYAPLTGQIVAVNPDLIQTPELVNTEPYGGGWMVRVRLVDPADFDALLDAAAYQALAEG
jgi:glycine cleavage system H protein